MNTMESRINDLIYARAEDIGKIVIKDKEYKDLEAKVTDLLYEIKKHLPEDKKYLVNELDSSNNAQVSIVESYMYKYGFKDGFKFNSFI